MAEQGFGKPNSRPSDTSGKTPELITPGTESIFHSRARSSVCGCPNASRDGESARRRSRRPRIARQASDYPSLARSREDYCAHIQSRTRTIPVLEEQGLVLGQTDRRANRMVRRSGLEYVGRLEHRRHFWRAD